MPSYKVSWTIDISAASPEAAVIKAQEIQRNPDSTATFFQIDGIGYDVSEETVVSYEQPGLKLGPVDSTIRTVESFRNNGGRKAVKFNADGEVV